MKYFFNLLSFLFLINTNFAQSSLLADNVVLEGLDDIYNLRFEDADRKFRQLQKSNPDNLKGYFYESLLYFYKALPTRDEKMLDCKS